MIVLGEGKTWRDFGYGNYTPINLAEGDKSCEKDKVACNNARGLEFSSPILAQFYASQPMRICEARKRGQERASRTITNLPLKARQSTPSHLILLSPRRRRPPRPSTTYSRLLFPPRRREIGGGW